MLNGNVDVNQNGIPDPLDIVNAARQEVKNRTTYKSAYYVGGYPPENEGVCTDVIWRAYMGVDINIKNLMDEDIKNNLELYPRVNGKPDPNIDFRRVQNMSAFFKSHCESLTPEIIKDDPENLKEFQPGDIIVFLGSYEHVGIVSDKRTRKGVPYVIHNGGLVPSENKITSFNTPISEHYRWRFQEEKNSKN